MWVWWKPDSRRLLTAQIVAVVCFVLFPLRFTFVQPEDAAAIEFIVLEPEND